MPTPNIPVELGRWAVWLSLLTLLTGMGWAGKQLHGLLFVIPVQVLLMWWALFYLWIAPPALRQKAFLVSVWELPLYQRLGVYSYMRLLRLVGWERFRRSAQGFDGTRATLKKYERKTREAEYSHLLLGFISLGLMLIALGEKHRDTALWFVLTTTLLHLYPVMLQRTLRARVMKLESRRSGPQPPRQI